MRSQDVAFRNMALDVLIPETFQPLGYGPLCRAEVLGLHRKVASDDLLRALEQRACQTHASHPDVRNVARLHDCTLLTTSASPFDSRTVGCSTSMKVLGISSLAHDTAAALVIDGQLIAFVEEERLNRDKHTWAFPDLSIQWCLDQAGLNINDVDAVAFDYRPGLDYARALAYGILPRLPRSGMALTKQTYADLRHVYKILRFRRRWGYQGRIRLLEHHLCHAASSFLTSPYDEAITLTVDRGGDYLSTAVYGCRDSGLRQLMKVHNPHSLGELYTAVTWWLGFTPNWDEGKVMALASFGRPTYLDDFRKMVNLRDDGEFRVDLSWAGWDLERKPLSPRFIDRFGAARQPGDPLTEKHEDIAYAVQAVLEETALHITIAAGRRWGASRPLCLSGGVVLNSVMNARLLNDGPFQNVFMQPAVGDSGNCLGAAIHLWHEMTGKQREFEMKHASWGPSYSNDEIKKALDERRLSYRTVADPAEEAAELISRGKITSWFQGGAEAGPRALGNRSILADPRLPDMKDTLNRQVKHREPFRPFAPSVLEEEASAWFDDYYPSPFMLLVLPIKAERRDLVPAVNHVDGTGRLQTVTHESNPAYRRLIESFYRRTGVPMVVNTSFNDNGEPIVCSPRDALRTYLSTGIDALVIGPYVLEKPNEGTPPTQG
jgi:carbamoyltransferase